MPEGGDLKAARRFVAGQERVSARLLMDVLRLEPRAALQLVQDMERLGDIARPDDSGWHAVLVQEAAVQPGPEPVGPEAADWRQRAEAAEARLAAGREDSRFDRLKRRLAREFHPDQAAASEIDRVVREVVFRRVWQIVQEVEDG